MLKTPEQQHNYLQQILDHSPDGMFTIDMDLKIRYANPAFYRLLGFDEGELIDTPITDYLGDLNILDTCMSEVSEKGFCNNQETIFKRKDGSNVHILKNVQAITNDDGSFKEILVSIRDMSDMHQLNKELAESLDDLRNAQQQLVESEKLASLGGLVAGIAHEINTPLGISLTASSNMHEELITFVKKFESNQLKKTELESFIEQAQKACNILNTNLNRASNLIRSFKQVAVDQSVDEHRHIDLCEYLDEVLLSIGPSLKHSKVELDYQCEDKIQCDTHPGALYQIISNLILNSVKHAYEEDSKGTIHISAKQQDGDIVITYQDDGKGISDENLKKIYTPFFTTRRGTGGSGLGLSIVYNLVNGTLKGSIQVESKEGHGTRFTIRFPYNA